MEFIISLLPTMKSTTCVSSQAGRQMRWEEEGEEEEEEEEEGEEEEEEQPRSQHQRVKTVQRPQAHTLFQPLENSSVTTQKI